jgi:hypothetical protein
MPRKKCSPNGESESGGHGYFGEHFADPTHRAKVKIRQEIFVQTDAAAEFRQLSPGAGFIVENHFKDRPVTAVAALQSLGDLVVYFDVLKNDGHEYHAEPQKQASPTETLVLVHAADLVCQKMGLGYGYEPVSAEENSLPQIWTTLAERFPIARSFTKTTYSELVTHLVSEAEKLADHGFTPVMSTR